MTAPPFRYLERTEPNAAANLALDEALLLAAEEHGGGPALRVWEPETLAVVLGASGRLHDDVVVSLCRRDGVELARRSSGGGTVVIGPGTVNVTVVLPVDADPDLRAVDTAQRFVLERCAAALRECGPDARVLGSGDLTLGGRKFAGSAQRRLKRWLLVHATILNAFPLDLIERYTRTPARQPEYRKNRPHAEFLTNLNLPRGTLLAALRGAWLGVPWAEGVPAPEVPAGLVEELVASRFGAAGWVERL